MENLPTYTLILLVAVAFIAGFIDTLAGGGGLITLPAVLLAGISPVNAIGTVKLQAAISEFSATVYFLRSGAIDYTKLVWAVIFTIIGSTGGTLLLFLIPATTLEKIIPFLLLAVLIYYIYSLYRKHIIDIAQNFVVNNRKMFPLGILIGFYNGFFGPGTGSIWALALMRVFNLDIRTATMYAKPLNLAGNLTALSLFISAGNVHFLAACLMGVGAFLGGALGAAMVMYKDAKWLKLALLILISTATASTFIKYY